MRQKFRAGAIALALLGSVSIAAAQSVPSGAMSTGGDHAKASLTPAQENALKQGLASEQTVSAPSGFQAEVGKQLPPSLTPQALPSNVEAQVPEAKSFLFVKLSDRVLLIDPATQQIAQVIDLSSNTTGNSSSNSSGETGGSR